MSKYTCFICGYTYDESVGISGRGIAPGTKWKDILKNWTCPVCGVPKNMFNEQESTPNKGASSKDTPEKFETFSYGQMSALCSNLSKACEKQYLEEESLLFGELAQYFKTHFHANPPISLEALSSQIGKDLEHYYPAAESDAAAAQDRGALRALTWSGKVTNVLRSLLIRHGRGGDVFPADTKVYLCEICGFVYIGGTAPEICPVCKVPSLKIHELKRRG